MYSTCLPVTIFAQIAFIRFCRAIDASRSIRREISGVYISFFLFDDSRSLFCYFTRLSSPSALFCIQDETGTSDISECRIYKEFFEQAK